MSLSHLSTGRQALHRGAYEMALLSSQDVGDPYLDLLLQVTFTRPDDTQTVVDGFYDGGRTYKARAYCDTLGLWRWVSKSNVRDLHGQSGTFEVVPSALKGKLRLHPNDPHQFAYDSGDWFLHIGDTGYRYVTGTEPEWQAYIDQAVQMGATKIRTWFCRERSDVQVLFDEARRGLNLPYWQEIDRRLVYALEQYPQLQFKLIPYGEDTDEIRRYETGDPFSLLIARYAQTRFSAFPNVHWCISNDREIVQNDREIVQNDREIVSDDARPLEGRQVYARTIDRMGRDMAAREPWGTLLTNHQCRWSGYDFSAASWSDMITLEDLDQVDGKILLEYRQQRAVPVINDEDRYETYRPPRHPRYFFRRLMWGSLLSGGHATYGGLQTYEPYDGELGGMQGYFDAVTATKIQGGAHDFRHIHRFFQDTGLTLVGLEPDDTLVGGDARRFKCTHDDQVLLIYLANPSGEMPETDCESETVPSVTVQLVSGVFAVRWFDPARGEWCAADAVEGGAQLFTAPGRGDWVLLIERA